MANIRASGFDSKDELQEHLLELVPDNEPVSSSDADANRAAEVELAWLRKEVSELQEQFSGMGSRAAERQHVHTDSAFWLKASLAVVAACTVGILIQRL